MEWIVLPGECCDLSMKLSIHLRRVPRSGVRVDMPPLAFSARSLFAGTTTCASNPIGCGSKQFITLCQHVTTLIVGKGRDCSDLGNIRTNYYGEEYAGMRRVHWCGVNRPRF
jgi:hypothetical protein